MKLITQKRLKEILDYDLNTGIFVWKVSLNRKIIIGSIAGCLDRFGYILIGINKKSYRAHRLAWLYVYGIWPINEIDHINGNTGDNKITNLRDVTCNINKQNRQFAQRNNKLGVLGVSPQGKLFRARITINRKYKHLGSFDTVESAHEKYLTEKRKYHKGNTL